MLRAFAALLALALAVPQGATVENLKPLLGDVSFAYSRLEPLTIRPAEGNFKYDYLIPAGFYKQMWDWDDFFIGSHLAHQSPAQAKYLKWRVLNFAEAAIAINKGGWVPGVLSADSLPAPKPSPVLGWVYREAFSGAGRGHRFRKARGLSVGPTGLENAAPHRRLS